MWQLRSCARNASAEAGALDELVERGSLRGHSRAPGVPARGPQLQLELVGGLEAPVRGQQRVAGWRARVVDERVQLGYPPAEQHSRREGPVG